MLIRSATKMDAEAIAAGRRLVVIGRALGWPVASLASIPVVVLSGQGVSARDVAAFRHSRERETKLAHQQAAKLENIFGPTPCRSTSPTRTGRSSTIPGY